MWELMGVNHLLNSHVMDFCLFVHRKCLIIFVNHGTYFMPNSWLLDLMRNDACHVFDKIPELRNLSNMPIF